MLLTSCLLLAALATPIQADDTGEMGDDQAAADSREKKRGVFIAGRASHGYGSHEHKAGLLLLAKFFRELRKRWLAPFGSIICCGNGDWVERTAASGLK
jgi:hypothetical protein